VQAVRGVRLLEASQEVMRGSEKEGKGGMIKGESVNRINLFFTLP
jgi:hypothetical protein